MPTGDDIRHAIKRNLVQRLAEERETGSSPAPERRPASKRRANDEPNQSSAAGGDSNVIEPKSMEELDAEGDRTEALALLHSIYADFSRNRNDGRSQAWAELENKIADAAPHLILARLISPKDLTALLIDIEQFRKQETGTQLPAGDWLAQWLSEKPPVDPKRKDVAQ